MSEAENTSGIEVVGHRILLRPVQLEGKIGLIALDSATSKKNQLAQVHGQVVAMGADCYIDKVKPWCAIGDWVTHTAYQGRLETGLDGHTYRTINDLDVIHKVDAKIAEAARHEIK